MAINTGQPFCNTTDGYLCEGKDIKGGYFVVDTIANAPAAITQTGSLCYCTGDSTFYQYNNGWAAATIKAQSFIAISDARLKKNIVEYTPVNSILDLPIKEYDYIDSNLHTIGCLAQDLQKICPELVIEDPNTGYLSIAETKLVYLLLDEVKKLKEEVAELRR